MNYYDLFDRSEIRKEFEELRWDRSDPEDAVHDLMCCAACEVVLGDIQNLEEALKAAIVNHRTFVNFYVTADVSEYKPEIEGLPNIKFLARRKNLRSDNWIDVYFLDLQEEF